MNEPIQILLFTVISILTILMVIIGYQIFLILGEFRLMLKKFNAMAENAVSISNNIQHSINNINGFSEGLKTILGIFNIFKRKIKSSDE